MKPIQLILRSGLLVTLTIVFLNCTKDVVETTSQNLNYSTFTDSRDSKTYKTIKIGNQEWMAENLAYTTINGSWSIGESGVSTNRYGCLYTWEAARQAVPAGWHLPTDEEWKQMESIVGMSQIDADDIDARGTNEGKKLKATSGWASNGNGTNEVGFTALPGGFRANSGDIYLDNWIGYWWSSTEYSNLNAWFRYIAASDTKVYRKFGYKEDGYSVRCVKN